MWIAKYLAAAKCLYQLTVWSFHDRNERGREMLKLVEKLFEITPTTSSVCLAGSFQISEKLIYKTTVNQADIFSPNFEYLFQGNRKPFVMETVKADDKAKSGMLLLSVC